MPALGWNGDRTDGGRQHMPVVRIGKEKPVDQVPVARDQAIRNGLVAERHRPLQLGLDELGPVSQQGRQPFVLDLLRPAGVKTSRLSQPDHQIPQRSWVKQARIVDDREARHLNRVQSEMLTFA